MKEKTVVETTSGFLACNQEVPSVKHQWEVTKESEEHGGAYRQCIHCNRLGRTILGFVFPANL